MMTYTGYVIGGRVLFDGPPPPDGAAVRVEVVANGVLKPAASPVDRTPLTLTPDDERVIPPDTAELLRTNPSGLSTRALESIRQAWHDNPDPPTAEERCPDYLKQTLDVPADVLDEAYRSLGRGYKP